MLGTPQADLPHRGRYLPPPPFGEFPANVPNVTTFTAGKLCFSPASPTSLSHIAGELSTYPMV